MTQTDNMRTLTFHHLIFSQAQNFPINIKMLMSKPISFDLMWIVMRGKRRKVPSRQTTMKSDDVMHDLNVCLHEEFILLLELLNWC